MNQRAISQRTAIAIALLWAHAALAQTFSSGSTGADGAFAPPTSPATQNITVRQGGVYHYTTVDIPAGVTVRYNKGPDNAPLVILATGNVNIQGTIVVSGFDGFNPQFAPLGQTAPLPGSAGGPGGFDGGMGGNAVTVGGITPTAGHGPGGGAPSQGVGGVSGIYGAPTSFVGLTPLFGGSGGGGGVGFVFAGSPNLGASGGGGGGAILIASSTKIIIGGAIKANGGAEGGGGNCNATSGAGSGGAIRLVAPEIVSTGLAATLQATRGAGGPNPNGCTGLTFASDGRIRLEAFSTSGYTGLAEPVPSVVNAPGAVSPAGNPSLVNVPTLAIASIGGVAVPAATTASYSVPDLTLAAGTANPIPVVINATNTPVGGTTAISVRLMPRGTSTFGLPTVVVTATDHTGTFASSTANVGVNLTSGQVTVIQASAAMTLTGQTASLFPLIDGEPVERVMVAALPGEASTLSLVTKSGKEKRLDELQPEDQMRVARAWQAMRETRTE